jgi:hypothetical protein
MVPAGLPIAQALTQMGGARAAAAGDGHSRPMTTGDAGCMGELGVNVGEDRLEIPSLWLGSRRLTQGPLRQDRPTTSSPGGRLFFGLTVTPVPSTGCLTSEALSVSFGNLDPTVPIPVRALARSR